MKEEWEIRDEFEKNNHLRLADKCCGNCKHGEDDWEGASNCKHPSLEYYDEFMEEKQYANIGAMQCKVCDKWEKREGNGESK